MTQPDIYTVEARRRLADKCGDDFLKKGYLTERYDDDFELVTLAATLRELNWQPPVDPDLVEARKMWRDANFGYSTTSIEEAQGYSSFRLTLAAIKRGRELEATERGA